MAAVENEDPKQVHAAQILASLKFRPLRRWPDWVPMQQQPGPGEASSSQTPGTVAAAARVMPPSGQASSSAGTVAAARVAPVRRPPERVVSMVQSGQASSSLAGALAAGVPRCWFAIPKAKRSAARGETSTSKLPEQGHTAAAAAAKGPAAPPRGSSEQERCAEMPAQQPVVAALCDAEVAGPGPSTTSAPEPANKEEPMKTPSPNSPLDYGAGVSGADDAAPAPAPGRTQAKRNGTGGDEEGCSLPAKRAPVAQEEEKPTMPISVEQSVLQSETRASSSGKGAPRPFDLNEFPGPMDEDGDGCPDTD